eukprot:Skav212167  [mRNA]  locus=scaffold754:290297:295578:+ [translate_table: standard]
MPALACNAWPKAPVPDQDLGSCRGPVVAGCEEHSMDGTDTCLQCGAFRTLHNGLALGLLGLPTLLASCDLPVGKLQRLSLPNEKSTADTWATAFGVSPEEWKSITAESDPSQLRDLLIKGYTDWADTLLADESTSLDRKVRKKLNATRALTQAVMTSSSLGEVFGNRHLAEASSAYYLLGFASQGTLQHDLEMLWKLHSSFGIFDLRGQQTKTCIQLLSESKDSKDFKELCRCEHLWVCDQQALVRVTLSGSKKVTENLASAVAPLRGVRILEFKGSKLLKKEILNQLLDFFPNTRVMTVRADHEPVDVDAFRSRTGSILGLTLITASTVVPDWVCEFQSLRYLHISGDSSKDSGEYISIKALPECLGNFSELIHLNVVGCNLTGRESLPNSLGNLHKLRIFEAFENGRLSEDPVDCPGNWLPNRSLCVPGYVAQDDGTPPVWRCPVHGWNIHFDDLTLPWWRWKSLEKMHIDANFIYGTIPESLPELWPRLRSLDLHDLKLEGPLPESLEHLVNLTQLQVQMNDLHCQRVDVVARLMKHPKLRNFNFDANPRLCGCLPQKAKAHLTIKFDGSSAKEVLLEVCEDDLRGTDHSGAGGASSSLDSCGSDDPPCDK